MKRLRRYLVAGLLIWAPLLVTVLVLRVLVGFVDRTLLLLPVAYRPDTLLGFHVPGLGIVLSVVVLLATGMLLANFVGHRLVAIGEGLLARIPLIRSVYSGAKQIAERLLGDGKQSFQKVVMLQYPRAGVWSLGFVTSEDLGEVQHRSAETLVCVFVPTTPNPTSGFLVMVPAADTIELEMPVDAAMRMIISLGVVVPEWRPAPLAPLNPTS